MDVRAGHRHAHTKSHGWLVRKSGGRPCSDGHWAGDDFVLQHDGYDEEDKVEKEHEEPQELAHPPLAGSNGDDDKQEHEEEQHDGTEQTGTAHGH